MIFLYHLMHLYSINFCTSWILFRKKSYIRNKNIAFYVHLKANSHKVPVTQEKMSGLGVWTITMSLRNKGFLSSFLSFFSSCLLFVFSLSLPNSAYLYVYHSCVKFCETKISIFKLQVYLIGHYFEEIMNIFYCKISQVRVWDWL